MDGGGQHQWAVDELDVNIIALPLNSNHATFTPTQPGTYLFYCDICCGGRASPAMQGALIVEAYNLFSMSHQSAHHSRRIRVPQV